MKKKTDMCSQRDVALMTNHRHDGDAAANGDGDGDGECVAAAWFSRRETDFAKLSAVGKEHALHEFIVMVMDAETKRMTMTMKTKTKKQNLNEEHPQHHDADDYHDSYDHDEADESERRVRVRVRPLVLRRALDLFSSIDAGRSAGRAAVLYLPHPWFLLLHRDVVAVVNRCQPHLKETLARHHVSGADLSSPRVHSDEA